MTEAVEMVPMMLRGCSAEEYVKRFGKKRNTLTQMFFRNMRKAADTAGSRYNSSGTKHVAHDCHNVRNSCPLTNRRKPNTNDSSGDSKRKFSATIRILNAKGVPEMLPFDLWQRDL